MTAQTTLGPDPSRDTAAGGWRDLDGRVWQLMGGFAFSALGSGLTMPFLYVYLAEVRGIATLTVGLTFAWMGLLGFLVSPVVGSLIDRAGPRAVMLLGLGTEAIGVLLLVWVDSTVDAVAVASLIVVGTAGLWPANTALLTRLVPPQARERVYAVNFMLLNAGLGVGGMVAAFLVHVDSVASFQRLYAIDAATYLVYIAVLLGLPAGIGRHVPPPDEGSGGGTSPSWRLVLADRVLLRVVAVSVLAITCGYAQVEAGFAAYAVEVAEVPARALGWAFGANTGAIVLGQLLVLRLIQGRRRSALLATCCALWAVSWLVIAAAAPLAGVLAVLALVAGLGLFGAAETVWAPVAPALVNDLAPEALRGRYNALLAMTWTVGSIVGPAMAGLLIGAGLAAWWVALVVGGEVVAAGLFLRLRRHLTDAQEGRRVPA